LVLKSKRLSVSAGPEKADFYHISWTKLYRQDNHLNVRSSLPPLSVLRCNSSSTNDDRIDQQVDDPEIEAVISLERYLI
jgi:hypothetical protein